MKICPLIFGVGSPLQEHAEQWRNLTLVNGIGYGEFELSGNITREV
jgi:hypothetical protein